MTKKTKVWTSEAWANSLYIKWISFESSPHEVAMAQRCRRGEFIDPSWFPYRVFQDHKNATLNHVSLIQSGLVLVSERFGELLRSFEFGNNQLVETELYDPTRSIKREGRFFILNVTEKKAGCLVYEESAGPFSGKANTGYLTSGVGYDGIAVREMNSIGGVDLWMDPILKMTPFFSGPLGDAIKKGKFGRTGLKPCVVLS
ncbi:DUF1629 domain-containing protein [uncultured Roseibium sp.]|uniref:imm11 family protein n=1 Tax=uncultured Roseibium sp. TaxID=1936171 RepID=UPI002601738A|nr:DUF1629 domain-containing protein [uncultured Roseibium sp.]